VKTGKSYFIDTIEPLAVGQACCSPTYGRTTAVAHPSVKTSPSKQIEFFINASTECRFHTTITGQMKSTNCRPSRARQTAEILVSNFCR